MGRKPNRAFLMCFAAGVLGYAIAVFLLVARMGDVGVRCIFGVEVKEPIPAYYPWFPVQAGAGSSQAARRDGGTNGRPQPGDALLTLGSMRVANYADYIKATRALMGRVGTDVEVSWRDGRSGEVRRASATVVSKPFTAYLWSGIWLLQEIVIFAIGARVFWKRPFDDSARIFFWICALTVGAYMGGYHWTEIVVEPLLIYPFAAFAVYLPVASLHFYLVFPRTNPVLVLHRKLILALLYGIPGFYLALLWGAMAWSRWVADFAPSDRVESAVFLIRNLALGYIGVSVGLFALCVLCLARSFRRAASRSERNQVQWILLASLIALVLIAYVLWQAWSDLSTFGRDGAAWPMFLVSLLFTVAHALCITRYKLMQADEVINRGMVYVAFSVGTGLLYSGVLVLIGVIFRDRFLSPSNSTSLGAVVAGLAVVLIMIGSELARGRFQKALDRQFYREKYKFDLAMKKMRVAVGSLVDRETLGRRLLDAAAEVLRLEWGAIYLADESPGTDLLRLAGWHGPAPTTKAIAPRRSPAGRAAPPGALTPVRPTAR